MAGILFVSALLFQLWLNANQSWEPKFKHAKWLPWKKSTWITLVITGGVWMTQSRGPWMGGALGCIIFLAIRAKRLKSGITNALVMVVVLCGVFYVVTDRYTNPSDNAMSMDKENAVYRRQLITNYMPIVKEGGMLGWGRDWPEVPGQGSIDNFYLLTALEFGYAGVGLYVLMVVITIYRLLRAAWTFKNREDATFALCLLAIFVSITATLTTVFLGAQVIAFSFMVLGWSQSLQKRRELVPVTVSDAQQVSMERFAYRRVFS
jgi:O-antigen ligase